MVGDVRIDNFNVDTLNVYVASENIATGPQGVLEFLRQQIEEAGADPEVLRDIGYDAPELAGHPGDAPTAEEQVEADAVTAERVTKQMIADIARANHLRNLVHHVDSARKLEGFQTNHERRPRKRAAVDAKQAEELTKAEESLQRACAQCVFQKTCRLEGNVNRWIDVHPYKDDNSGKSRPGSLPVGKIESRTRFLRGLGRNPAIHCDPAKRK